MRATQEPTLIVLLEQYGESGYAMSLGLRLCLAWAVVLSLIILVPAVSMLLVVEWAAKRLHDCSVVHYPETLRKDAA